MKKQNKNPEIPEPFNPNPHFGDEENRRIIESEMEGGVYLKDLPMGGSLEVETVNTIYSIEKREDGFYISGNIKFCPEPTRVNINGSTFGGSMLKMGFIGRGMHLEFILPEGQTITTSKIIEIKEFPASKK